VYTIRPGYVLGFHGCDITVAQKVIRDNHDLKQSENDYDWLGHGVYFWESNCSRALEFAEYCRDNPQKGASHVKKPAVLGAVIALGHCLDLLESEALHKVKIAYDSLKLLEESTGWSLPENVGGTDLRLRRLDCAVIEFLHDTLDEEDEKYFDSVRGIFTEGNPLYPNAGFHEKDHIQLCIRNPNCIKGYFLPRDLDIDHRKV